MQYRWYGPSTGYSAGGVGLAQGGLQQYNQTYMHCSDIFWGGERIWQHWPTIAVPGKQVVKYLITQNYHLEGPFFVCLLSLNGKAEIGLSLKPLA